MLRMGYVLRTNSSQLQGLVFLQKDAGDKGREKSKATKKREREDAEDEEIIVKKAKAQEDQQQRDDKKVRLGEEKVRLAEEKARCIEQAVLLREHEMKVEVAESERKRSAEVAEELCQQLQKQVEQQLKLTAESAEERGRRMEREQHLALQIKKDEKHEDTVKGAFAANSELAKDAMNKQSAQLALMFNMYSQFTSLAAGRGAGGYSENAAAQEGMQACTQHLLGNAASGAGSKGGTAVLLMGSSHSEVTPEKKSKKLRKTGNEVRQFLGACNAEAKKTQVGLKSRDTDEVAEAGIELSVHRGIADGDIAPEEGEDGKSEKILELLTSWSAI
ncbi:hypothetical protein CYMTET_22105 [Cymbomonas tetramitiformis]|uniref:Uncharacterized protein n=1 Tax=Cymbomonas tetramitiformis TaxID=36881 RepID=A0AAE0G0W7_9CHLO|nr:hypothetical protein CYMTET_22105 [Cymbomonas tetramitiformis]